jgi:hypothetical protein
MTQNWNDQPWASPAGPAYPASPADPVEPAWHSLQVDPASGSPRTVLRVIAAAVVAAIAATAVLWFMGGFGSSAQGSGGSGTHVSVGTKTTSPATPTTAGSATPSNGPSAGGADVPVALTGGGSTGGGSSGGGGSSAPAKPTVALSVSAKSAAAYTGPCTQVSGSNSFTYTAQVSVSKGPVDVILWWTQGTGTTTPTQTVHFAGTGLQQQAIDYAFTGVNYTFSGTAQAHAQIGSAATVDSNASAFTQTCTSPDLALSTPLAYNTVQQGQYYTANATGFLPGEAIAFTFGGQAAGSIGTYVANSAGAAQVQVGPMGGNYGVYTIYARGSRTNAQDTQTLKLTPVQYMNLSQSSVSHGQSYLIYADHFQPYETITFSITGAANATLGTVVANGYGNATLTAATNLGTGGFTVHTSGNTSHLVASAPLTVS